MLLAVTALATPILNPDAGDQHQSKIRQIYWRLLDIVYKIDCIDGQSNGNDFISLQELGTDHKLANKFNVISASIWGENSSVMANP